MRGRLIGGVALGVLAQLASIGLLLSASWLIVRAAEHPPVLYLMVAIVAVRTFGIARSVLRYAERLLTHDAAFAAGIDARVTAYEDLDRTAPSGLTGRRRGDVISRVVSDVAALQDQLLRVRIPWWTGLVSVTAVALLVGALEPLAGVVVVAAALLVVSGLRTIITRWHADDLQREAAVDGDLAAEVSQLVLAAPDLVAYDAVEAPRAAAKRATAELARLSGRGAHVQGAGGALVMIAVGLAVGTLAALTGDVDRVLVGVLLLAPIALVEPMEAWADAVRLGPATTAAAQRLADLHDAPVQIAPTPDPAPRPERWDLAVRDLVVGWDTDLAGPLTFDVPQGNSLAIRGPSGGGKSTLALTLARLIAPRSGDVLLGGVPVDRLAIDDVRSVVGYLAQDEVVFDTSIRENLRIARPDATDDQMREVLGRAGLADFVARLPRGLDTPLGEHGGRLSGGERQRLAIARLLLGGHRVLVVDEPTEHLDAETGSRLMDDLLALCPDRSVIVVSHVPEVVERCAQVVDVGTGPVVTAR